MKFYEYITLGQKAENVLLEIENFQNGKTTDVCNLLCEAKEVIRDYYCLITRIISNKNIEDILKK